MKQLHFTNIFAAIAASFGLLLFDASCNSGRTYQGTLIPAQDDDNLKWGFADTTGKIRIRPQWDYVDAFSEGLAVVSSNSKYGYIDREGKEVIPLAFDSARFFSDSLAAVASEGKWGFVNMQGDTVIPLQFSKAEPFSHGLANVETDAKYGRINIYGAPVERFIFKEPQTFSGSIPWAKSKGAVMRFTMSADATRITEMNLDADEVVFSKCYNGITSTTYRDMKVSFGKPPEIVDNKIVMDNFCDLTVSDACLYGTVQFNTDDCESISAYAVFKNITTPQEIPEAILKGN